MEDAIFLIEGGKALELVRSHFAEWARVRKQSQDLARELGVEHVWTSREDGVVVAVDFKGAVPADFTGRGAHGSRPKRGTEWAKRFAEQVGYRNPSALLMDGLGIPCCISYLAKNGHGTRRLGLPFAECGFMWVEESGPYAMWLPDIEAEVRAELAAGRTVEEPAASFRMEFDGCRRISEEEWARIAQAAVQAEEDAAAEAGAAAA
ncbi:hypothetical protein [Burkholderia ambifaria]|uniref:hypothetical protein n=1 Tax=Burkholderia ambifaria TaxID=152480 RepID=UPI000F7FF214|nr:hypothetical protein [Burkholderia ambifaria]